MSLVLAFWGRNMAPIRARGWTWPGFDYDETEWQRLLTLLSLPDALDNADSYAALIEHIHNPVAATSPRHDTMPGLNVAQASAARVAASSSPAACGGAAGVGMEVLMIVAKRPL